jgi:hypothetical protein
VLGWLWDRRHAAEQRASHAMREALRTPWPPGRPRKPRPGDAQTNGAPPVPAPPDLGPWTGEYLPRGLAGALARTIHPKSSDEYVKTAAYEGVIRAIKVAPKLTLYYQSDVIAWAQGRLERDQARAGVRAAKATTNGHGSAAPVIGKKKTPTARRPA